MKKVFLFFSFILIAVSFVNCSKENENNLIINTLKNKYTNSKIFLLNSEKLCNFGHPYFCYLAAKDGDGIFTKNKVINLFKRGCNIKIRKLNGKLKNKIFTLDKVGKRKSCYNYAIYLYNQNKLLKSNKILKNLCKQGIFLACKTLAKKTLETNKISAVKYIAKTIKTYNKLNIKDQKNFRNEINTLSFIGVELCLYGEVMNRLMGGDKEKDISSDCETIIKNYKNLNL
jgi:hypothetical protein